MVTKKDIPFNLLKVIEAIAQQNLDIIQLRREEDTYYSFVETDPNSKNFFKIFIQGNKRIGNMGVGNFAYEFKPIDRNRISHQLTQGNLQSVTRHFEAWINLTREVNDTPSIHDDNFTKRYSEFYFEEFKISEKDANIVPFDPCQQDLIESYLDSLTIAIENSNHELLNVEKKELVLAIHEIKEALTISSKNHVMKAITKIFGRLYKVSKPFAKEVIAAAKKHLIKGLIELGTQYAPKILELLC